MEGLALLVLTIISLIICFVYSITIVILSIIEKRKKLKWSILSILVPLISFSLNYLFIIRNNNFDILSDRFLFYFVIIIVPIYVLFLLLIYLLSSKTPSFKLLLYFLFTQAIVIIPISLMSFGDRPMYEQFYPLFLIVDGFYSVVLIIKGILQRINNE